MRKALIVAAALWTGVSFAQGNEALQQKQIGNVKYTPSRLYFVPPEELAKKPNRPQASNIEYTASMTVQGTADNKPWSVTVPLRTYAIVSPRDAASGLPTGKRMHKPMVLTMETSVAAPLVSHFKPNDVISTVTVSFTPVVKAPSHTFVIRSVANFRQLATNGYTEVAFTYQKITWTWVDGGITASDDWEAPVV